MNKNIITCILLSFLSIGIIFIINKSIELKINVPDEYLWLFKAAINVLGYLTILIPGYVIYKLRNNLSEFENPLIQKFIPLCFQDEIIDCIVPQPATTSNGRTCQLLFYTIGLQISFLSWGILQEKIMTQPYNGTGKFKDSQFLVFINRILAFIISSVIILSKRQPRHKCPLYKYTFCSLSNIMSSWCQYEALKYVSFPHQVLAKASKTIPVMLVGKIVSRNKYKLYEYVTAIILSIGMLFFLLDTGSDLGTKSTLSGVILLCFYLSFDSFTSNWQGCLFKQYAMTPLQMMCGVNLFSSMFTAISLLQQGGIISNFEFMLKYPNFTFDCFLLSVSSATGQLFIFSTIATFGPVTFAIISTVRQGLSVLLSCLIYKHEIHAIGLFGIILVFFSILLRIYCNRNVN